MRTTIFQVLLVLAECLLVLGFGLWSYRRGYKDGSKDAEQE